MLNTDNISVRLRWALDNVDGTIQEIDALDGGVQIRLSDGRVGLLVMTEIGPMAAIPACT